MEEKVVLIEKKDAVCTLIMNRPKVKNCFTMETLLELQEACCQIRSDKSIKVVVLEGAGGNFCSGSDVVYFRYMQGPPDFLEMMQNFNKIIKDLRELPQPIITKVRGVAVGGGANLALAGDFVLASDTAKFSQVFIKMNIIPDGGGTYFLPRLVGLVKARELAFLGDMIDGKTAQSIGLIYKSVPDEKLDEDVDSLAKNLSQRSLTALSLTKSCLEKSFERSLDTCLEWEAAYQCVCSETEEHKEEVRRVWEPKGKHR